MLSYIHKKLRYIMRKNLPTCMYFLYAKCFLCRVRATAYHSYQLFNYYNIYIKL